MSECICASQGRQEVEEGILVGVNDFLSVLIKIEAYDRGIPFIGYDCAIQKITGKKGKVLYWNPLIPDDYNLKEWHQIERTRVLSFGRNLS